MKRDLFFIAIIMFLSYSLLIQCAQKPIKLLVFILASDDLPVYSGLHKIWRAYMQYNPEQVESYFLKCDPNLACECEIKNDVIWTKGEEILIPGATNKTLASMEIMLPRIDEFDYILRTNLSSFYIFPRLLKFLETKPRERFYCSGGDIGFGGGSGAGFIISPDLFKLLVAHKQHFWNNTSSYDDVLIGWFLKNNGIRLIMHPRIDLLAINSWHFHKDKIPFDLFQFRIKTPHRLRAIDDVHIQSHLLKMFYNQEIRDI